VNREQVTVKVQNTAELYGGLLISQVPSRSQSKPTSDKKLREASTLRGEQQNNRTAEQRLLTSSLPVKMVGPTANLSQLHRADGSASYKCPATGYNILGAVNAPVELPGRRDALKPEEATVEVFVKPGTTTAGVGERYVEGILRSVLGKVVLGREKGFPRRGVVLTLAIVGGENIERGDSVSFPVLSSLY
jgi:hypothetical protein